MTVETREDEFIKEKVYFIDPNSNEPIKVEFVVGYLSIPEGDVKQFRLSNKILVDDSTVYDGFSAGKSLWQAVVISIVNLHRYSRIKLPDGVVLFYYEKDAYGPRNKPIEIDRFFGQYTA